MLHLRVFAPDLRLELDKLLGNFVVGTLVQYPQDDVARLVHVDAAASASQQTNEP